MLKNSRNSRKFSPAKISRYTVVCPRKELVVAELVAKVIEPQVLTKVCTVATDNLLTPMLGKAFGIMQMLKGKILKAGASIYGQ